MKLEIGNRNEDVRQLQIFLTKLGFDTKGIDGIFGINTKTALKEFQSYYYSNGICDDKVFSDLFNLYNKKLQEEQNHNKDRIKVLRRFDSDVYVFETDNLTEFVDIEIGQEGKLEPLSKITKEGKNIIFKMNGVFFNFGAKTVKDEVLGMFIDEGKIYNRNSDGYISFIYYKEGHTTIRYVDHPEDIRFLQEMANWAIGVAGWSLIKNGNKDLTNSDKFPISTERHPRSLIGQKKNGSFVLVVVDGRIDNNKGITAEQSYEIMKELNCWNAINLDGGFSSEMIYNGKIINKMAQIKGERSIGSAILVYKK